MGREDLALGRGRKTGASVMGSASQTAALSADSKRVAILMSWALYAYFDSGGATAVIDSGGIIPGSNLTGNRAIQLTPGQGSVLLRIEDVGSIVQGAWSVFLINSSGVGSWSLTPITTEVDDPPIIR